VIEGDAGDGTDQGMARAGGVQAPAQAGLQDGHVDLGLGKSEERQDRRHLEIRERHLRGLHLIIELGQVIAVDLLPVDSDAFGEAPKVR